MSKYASRSLELAIGAPGTNVVAQVNALGEAGSSRALIDASSYGDDWTDFVLGQQDGDSVTMALAYDPDDVDHEALVTTYDAATQETFHYIHEESGFHVKFPGLITALNRGGARDGMLTMNITVKILNPGVEDVTS